MPQIIYEKKQGALIPTGDRVVSTYPSGMIRVEQSFICSNANAASQRGSLRVGADFPTGSSPAIDGVKIYPDVQEIRRSDGFTEFRVTGYGRMTDSARIIKEYDDYDVVFKKVNIPDYKTGGTQLYEFGVYKKVFVVQIPYITSQGYYAKYGNYLNNLFDSLLLPNPLAWRPDDQKYVSLATYDNKPEVPSVENYGFFSVLTTTIKRF
jgi:hypothetical protein